jgi:hypothetical protein
MGPLVVHENIIDFRSEKRRRLGFYNHSAVSSLAVTLSPLMLSSRGVEFGILTYDTDRDAVALIIEQLSDLEFVDSGISIEDAISPLRLAQICGRRHFCTEIGSLTIHYSVDVENTHVEIHAVFKDSEIPDSRKSNLYRKAGVVTPFRSVDSPGFDQAGKPAAA